MRSIELERRGEGFEGVVLADRPVPEPGRGEVRVRMLRAPIHPSDLNHIRGTYREALAGLVWNVGRERPAFDPAGELPCPDPPCRLGAEGVGVVEAAGGGLLARRLVGRRVAVAASPTGTWAEHLVADARRAIPVGDDLSLDTAGSLLVNPLTAVLLVREVLAARPGTWVLQTAAASTLGRIVVGLGRRDGFRTLNVVRSEASAARLRQLGAEHVVTTDGPGLVEAVHALTGGRGVDGALDCVGGSLGGSLVHCLAPGGHLVVYGTLSTEPFVLPTRALMMPVARVTGFYLPGWLARYGLLGRLRLVRQVLALAGEGLFDPGPTRPFALGDHQAALAAAAGGGEGKVFFEIG